MIRLHDYWRSGAGHRVRIALNLKGLAYERVTHDLRTGQHHDRSYRTLNPQGLLPALEAGGQVITQSLAILEWLEERYPAPPLLPAAAHDRAIVRSMAQIVAADIHPLNNLRVLDRLRGAFDADDHAVRSWIARWISDGFSALEVLIAAHTQGFAFRDRPTMADCCLIPQIYSAERFGVDLTPFPQIRSVGARCAQEAAFAAADPASQSDAG